MAKVARMNPWARVARVREEKLNHCTRVAKVTRATGKRDSETKRKKSRARSLSPEPKKKAKESRKHRNKSCRYSSSEDSTTTSSDTSSSESGKSRDEILAKTERFHVVAQEDINKYDLPAELAEYANEYCSKFMPEKEIKESLLYDHPVFNSIQGINQLDSFMRDILKDKDKELLIKSILEKVHQRTRYAYGPLAGMWSYLEEIIAQ